MKKTIVISAAILLILGACKNTTTTTNNNLQTFNLDTNTLKSGQAFYQCPMDLEILSDKAGTCPKCKMDLEVRTKQ